jgi:hypothetical protein
VSVCEFDIAVRIIASDGVTEVFDFNDHTAGMVVVSRQEFGDEANKSRVEADGVDGDYLVDETDAAGDYIVYVRVEGSTWPECTTRWLAARAAYRAEANYYLEVEVQGVTTRYRTGRPDSVQPGASDLINNRQTYMIRWHVQPNPTISIA